MLKKTLFAAAALVAATTAFQPVQKAQARVNIGIHLGLPGVYAPGYYGPAYAPAPVYVPRYIPRVSLCRQARRSVRNSGYYRIRAVDCSGSRYTFHAKRGGVWYRLRIRARSGYIYKV